MIIPIRVHDIPKGIALEMLIVILGLICFAILYFSFLKWWES